MHCRHHQLQDGVEDRPRLLRVDVAHKLRRPFEIGEQRGNCLAFAVEMGRVLSLCIGRF
jgi:hypothetical protein